MVVEKRERKSTQVGLKNADMQVEDQCKLHYQTEIKLAPSRQLVMDLRAELQQAKEAAQLAREAAEVKGKHPTPSAWRKHMLGSLRS